MVRVVGSFNPYIRILGCKGGDKIVQLPDKTDAKVRFRDGTAIRVSFGKGNLGIWEITIMRKGTAFQRLEPCENRSLALFSDVFWIAEDVKDVTFIEKKPPRQYISCCLCKHYIGGGDWGLCCPFIPYPDLIYKDTEANTHCENKFELKDGETIWQPPEKPKPVRKKKKKVGRPKKVRAKKTVKKKKKRCTKPRRKKRVKKVLFYMDLISELNTRLKETEAGIATPTTTLRKCQYAIKELIKEIQKFRDEVCSKCDKREEKGACDECEFGGWRGKL